jgi:hypothetical protein
MMMPRCSAQAGKQVLGAQASDPHDKLKDVGIIRGNGISYACYGSGEPAAGYSAGKAVA